MSNDVLYLICINSPPDDYLFALKKRHNDNYTKQLFLVGVVHMERLWWDGESRDIVDNCWQNIIINAVIIIAIACKALLLQLNLMLFVFKILITCAKDLWWQFDSLDTFFCQHASELVTIFHYDNGGTRKTYQTSIHHSSLRLKSTGKDFSTTEKCH